MFEILNKIYRHIDDKIQFSDEILLIKESFELLNFNSKIILIDSTGAILSCKNNELKRSLANKSVNKNSLHLEQFGDSQCPFFYLLVNENMADNYNLKELGRKIQKNFMLINSYKTKYDTLITYLDAIQEGISAIDKDGFLIFVNKACCDIVGASKEELLYKKADSISNKKPLLMEIIQNKHAEIDKEYFMEFKTKRLHLTNSGYPVFDADKNILGAIDSFKSINRSRKLANLIAGKEASFKFHNIIGDSKIMQSIISKAKKMASSNATILIEGASGCGKELFAQAIHNYSPRKNEAFITINCANLPNELVESELFGYETGAFTGAIKGGKPGKFELAHGGTLFLDEIGEMPLHIQSKLLRSVEYKYINRVGGNRSFNVDVRIIAATNRNLETLVKEGKFRGDLFYRLKVFYLKIPPLAERENDIISLIEYYIKKFSFQMKKNITNIEDEAKNILMNYEWPGNVRELENCMARAVFLCEDNKISTEHIVEAGIHIDNYLRHNIDLTNNHRLYELSSERVREVYECSNRNKTKSAEILGISRPTLYKLLKIYNIN